MRKITLILLTVATLFTACEIDLNNEPANVEVTNVELTSTQYAAGSPLSTFHVYTFDLTFANTGDISALNIEAIITMYDSNGQRTDRSVYLDKIRGNREQTYTTEVTFKNSTLDDYSIEVFWDE